ncbi:carbohydrate ABC transporter permease [Lachnoclostridium sp. An196]|uniref:carbohydrate ABC transporter permease n=1 Tax=Lachnoclostridium sp. An196 TaxID=1965583 RepID=UPI001FA83A79|nr:sugar ABC transporter permease [Lachnoclostridium sp. An196]
MTERPTQAARRKFAVPRKVLPYLMLAPALIIIFVFKIYPIVSVMITSFIRDGQFTFRTYEILLGDRTFWMSLWTTIKMNLVMIPLQIVLSLALALLVNSTVKGIGIFRSIYYLPVTMAISVAAITWELMANYNNGVFNSLFTALGIGRQGLFTDANQALWCIVVMATWKGCGMWMMYILAGLKGVDTSIYESARLDGAGYFRTLFSITLPLIKRTMLFVIVANTSANMLLFAPMQLITEGGPQNSTNVLMYEVYKSAFQNGNASRAGALTTILLIIVLTVVIIQFRMLNEKEE